jgi:hypothetical protein
VTDARVLMVDHQDVLGVRSPDVEMLEVVMPGEFSAEEVAPIEPDAT